jgi:diguanylate cyclase (GGDEF)-like protein
MDLHKPRSFVIRHRFAIRDFALLAGGLLLTLYCGWAIDLFRNEGTLTARQAIVELDEALLAGGLLAAGLLVAGWRQFRAQRREMDRRLAAERRIREIAYQDALTGLPNRRRFDDALKVAVDSPPRAGAAHGVFLLDLNGFKAVNDVHGHNVGDEVLMEVAQRLLGAMREGDLVARFGGDEFAVLAMHLAGPEAATNVALRVIEAVDPPIEAAGRVHRVGVGVGIALLPADAHGVEEILRKADVALYRAKAERRSALRFFEEEMDARIHERAEMEAALRAAIDGAAIETVFRPTINLRTHEVTGFAAEPRWGDVAPERFLAIAEETGLIHALAERVLRQGCAAARSWPARVSLSVDLYPGQLKDRLLAARMVRILSECGLDPRRLEAEITESALVANMDDARPLLGELRAAGIRIALDNFGTGYSTLYHLRNLSLDKVKIDRSFIEAAAGDVEGASIVRALAGLGHGLGLTVAAEGTLGPGQEAALIGSGFDEGAAVGEGMSAKDAEALVKGAARRLA